MNHTILKICGEEVSVPLYKNSGALYAVSKIVKAWNKAGYYPPLIADHDCIELVSERYVCYIPQSIEIISGDESSDKRR